MDSTPIASDSTEAAQLMERARANLDRRKITSPNNGSNGGRPRAPNHADTATLFLKEKLSENGVPTVRHWRDTWWTYSATGWASATHGEMLKRILTWLQTKDEPLADFCTITYAQNVLANLSAFELCGIPATAERPCWLASGEDARNWMAFSNGLAVDVWDYAEALAKNEVPAGCVRSVTPDLFSTDYVPYPWDEDPGEPELFLKYLRRVCPAFDVFEAVRRAAGLLLADCSRFEVFFQLVGNGANGKTVLLDIIEALVGRQNVSHVALESLAPGMRFQSWPLATAKVNISGELATDIGHANLAAVEGQFKHAVSGGNIEIERKGVDKMLARCRARFIMASNTLPTFIDKTDAIWRRLRIIPFDVQIPNHERDVHLAAKIVSSELPAILLWALNGLADVIRDGHFQECSRGAAIKEMHRSTCDHEREFLAEHFEAGDDSDRIASAVLYDEYKTWMSANGYRGVMGAGKFKQRVEETFPAAVSGNIRVNQVEVAKGWKGIRRRVADVAAAILDNHKPN